MEIALREPVANAAEKLEVKELLNDSRFVDDLCHSDDNQTRLVENVKEYIKMCSKFGFEHGDVSSTHNVYEGKERNQVRTLLGIEWNPETDMWKPNSDWNVSSKCRGTYKEKSLMEMTDEELESTEITRTLISRILGQTHEPCEKV